MTKWDPKSSVFTRSRRILPWNVLWRAIHRVQTEGELGAMQAQQFLGGDSVSQVCNDSNRSNSDLESPGLGAGV